MNRLWEKGSGRSFQLKRKAESQTEDPHLWFQPRYGFHSTSILTGVLTTAEIVCLLKRSGATEKHVLVGQLTVTALLRKRLLVTCSKKKTTDFCTPTGTYERTNVVYSFQQKLKVPPPVLPKSVYR